MNISARINTILNLIIKGSVVADIGSDHGYLLVALLKSKISKKVLGVENKIGPFNRLKSNLDLHLKEYRDNYSIILSDGLADVDSSYDTIVIAGMGFITIKNLILRSIEKVKYIKYFIIDSHNNTYELRKFMVNLGYIIDKESDLVENDIFYEIIRFKKGTMQYLEIQYKYGPILLLKKDKYFIRHYKTILTKYSNLLKTKKLSNSRKEELENEIEELKGILYEN